MSKGERERGGDAAQRWPSPHGQAPARCRHCGGTVPSPAVDATGWSRRATCPAASPHHHDPAPWVGGAPNLLTRQCDVERPNHVWVGDLPSGWTAEGWLSVSVV
jgi:hypothetical protein